MLPPLFPANAFSIELLNIWTELSFSKKNAPPKSSDEQSVIILSYIRTLLCY